MNETIEDVISSIIDWEIKTGKSFAIYFMSNILDSDEWAYWLLGEGYVKHANNILMLLLADVVDIDKKTLYDIYIEDINDEESYQINMLKNIEIMGNFIIEHPKCLVEFNEFLKK